MLMLDGAGPAHGTVPCDHTVDVVASRLSTDRTLGDVDVPIVGVAAAQLVARACPVDLLGAIGRWRRW